ncbi:iron-sulfur cluster repair di-iron protein [Alicyclobacillus mengziensis]|uniref:Iron-sulfur cluster repair di-iron protein n=1 Tax=Alicyclobacillus mengziensis TaxID=2931921 RepID=A0A9X7VYE7_9BACL|nr:iron-sulfur cluster repair di-iron protein [Alicyclobacillus mengziensis]QSO46028.1 iron-sulfur cluster repair di-iron protein [Alicyclobacillus mengziensis]
MFNTNSKLGDIVTTYPDAGTILKGYKVDYCCGGDRTVYEAIQGTTINVEQLLTELNAGYEQAQMNATAAIDWKEQPFDKLISHVVNTHHAYLQKTLPILGELTTKILRVHGPNHSDTLSPLHKSFHIFKMDIEQHMIKEETNIFPLIIKYQETGDVDVLSQVLSNIKVLEDEHTESGNLLKQMRSVTNDYSLPEDACGTYSYTFQKLAELEEDMFRHVHLENNVLFPRLERLA